MKKITVITLTAVMGAGLFSCGAKDEEIKKNLPVPVEQTTDANGKSVVTLGALGYNDDVMRSVNDFNSRQKEYVVELKNYSYINDVHFEYKDALRNMELDFISGDCSDIVTIPGGDMANLVRSGAFTDMYEFMDNFEGVKREDFLPNVLKGFEVDGKIPAISDGWWIYTAAAKTSVVGADAENWTPGQAAELYNSRKPDQYFLADNGDYVAEFFTKKAGRNCVDLKNNTCNFNSEDFISNLEFITGTRPDYETSSFFEMISDEFPNVLKDERALVSEIRIQDMAADSGYQIWSAFHGEDITYVGYPSTDGKGYYTQARELYAVPVNAANKEGAWAMLNWLFSPRTSKENNYNGRGLPVLKSVLDELAEEKNGASRKYNANVCIRQTPSYIDDTFIPDEDIQKLYDYIVNAEFEPYFSYEIDSIVSEEISAVIKGEKTPQQCADLLQNRISIYLSEKE